MLYSLCGIISKIFDNTILLNVGNFEFLITCLKRNTFIKEQKVKIFVYTYLNSENEFVCFGFSDLEDLRMFKLLIKINGIGCKVAMQVLDYCPSNELVNLIKKGDIESISKIPKLGNKSRLVYFYLKDKIFDLNNEPSKYLEAYNILTKLGFNKDLVKERLNYIDTTKSVDEIIKIFLRKGVNE